VPGIFEVKELEADLKCAPPKTSSSKKDEAPEDDQPKGIVSRLKKAQQMEQAPPPQPQAPPPKKAETSGLTITGVISLDKTIKFPVKNSSTAPCLVATINATEMKTIGFAKLMGIITGGQWDINKNRYLKTQKILEGEILLYWHPEPYAKFVGKFEGDWKYESQYISIVHDAKLEITITSKNGKLTANGVISGQAELAGMAFQAVPMSYQLPDGPISLFQCGVEKVGDVIRSLAKVVKDTRKLVALMQHVYGEKANSLVRNQLAQGLVTAITGTGVNRTEVVSIVNDVFKTRLQ